MPEKKFFLFLSEHKIKKRKKKKETAFSFLKFHKHFRNRSLGMVWLKKDPAFASPPPVLCASPLSHSLHGPSAGSLSRPYLKVRISNPYLSKFARPHSCPRPRLDVHCCLINSAYGCLIFFQFLKIVLFYCHNRKRVMTLFNSKYSEKSE